MGRERRSAGRISTCSSIREECVGSKVGSGGNLAAGFCVDDFNTGIGLRKYLAAYTERWPLRCGLASNTTPQTNSLTNGRLALLISLSSLHRGLEISRKYVIDPAKREPADQK